MTRRAPARAPARPPPRKPTAVALFARAARAASVAFAALALALAGAGCHLLDPPPPEHERVLVRVSSDPGRPLKGATLSFEGQAIAETGDDGVAQLTITGNDGDRFAVTVACPAGYDAPARAVEVILRRLTGPSKLPEYEALCVPSTRTLVVAIRADNGANLPVVYLGKEIARTDTSGAATVSVPLPEGDQVELQLDTSDASHQRLRPLSPRKVFRIGPHDDVFTFEERFTRVDDKPLWKPPIVKPQGPQRIE